MNIFLIAFSDYAGGCYNLARAINETFPGKHEAISARHVTNRLKYPCHLSKPSPSKVVQMVKWSDVVILTNRWNRDKLIPPGSPRRPTLSYYRGTDYRNRAAKVNQEDRKAGRIQMVNFLDLAVYGGVERWLPVPVWDLSSYRKKDKEFVVVQCPTVSAVKANKKNTKQVKKFLTDVEGIDFRIISRVTHKVCLKEKGRADVLIDAFKHGYGNNGLEAWSMGIPVVANVFDELADEMEERIGYLPFLRTRLRDLKDTVLQLKNDKVLYQEYVDRGIAYLRDFHHPISVAKTAINYCQEAIDAWQG